MGRVVPHIYICVYIYIYCVYIYIYIVENTIDVWNHQPDLFIIVMFHVYSHMENFHMFQTTTQHKMTLQLDPASKKTGSATNCGPRKSETWRLPKRHLDPWWHSADESLSPSTWDDSLHPIKKKTPPKRNHGFCWEFHDMSRYIWLVVDLPLWIIWVRQWEGWHPIYEMENLKNDVWNQQPDMPLGPCNWGVKNIRLGLFQSSLGLSGESWWIFQPQTWWHRRVPGLVNCHITMENHHFSWENSLFIWPCSIAM